MSLDCKDVEPVLGCRRAADGTILGSVVIHYEYRNGTGGNARLHATRYTQADGTAIALAVGETVTAGACPVVTLINGVGGNLAGAPRTAQVAFSGLADTVTLPAAFNIQSLTVTAQSVINGGNVGSTANQVYLTFGGAGPVTLFNGQTYTWSVARDQDARFAQDIVITCTGLAYANWAATYQ
jgi:hypothetical protein